MQVHPAVAPWQYQGVIINSFAILTKNKNLSIFPSILTKGAGHQHFLKSFWRKLFFSKPAAFKALYEYNQKLNKTRRIIQPIKYFNYKHQDQKTSDRWKSTHLFSLLFQHGSCVNKSWKEINIFSKIIQ